jgi:limonene-1,2-epoxide hydrolase
MIARMSNCDIVSDFIAAWNDKDLERVMSFFTPDAVYHNIPMAPVQGTQQIRAVIDGYAAPASKIEWIVTQIAETPDGVVLTERLDGFQFGDKRVELPVMGAFELQGGKIAAWRDYFDMAQFQRQMAGD